MNLDKLVAWIVAVVLLCSATGNLDHLQKWVWKAQAKAIYASRSLTWGSPRFFSHETSRARMKSK